MSPSEGSPTRKLIIDTKTPATEITLIDSAGKVITASVRKLELDLSPALYKIRYRVGNRVVDQLIDLAPEEGPYEVQVPPLPILSAAPLSDAGAGPEAASARFANELIMRPVTRPGKPGSLFLFMSVDAESSNDPSDAPANIGRGISIHTFSGEKIGDLENAEMRAGCCGTTLRVDPGKYILRMEMPAGRPVEQTLVAVEGWQVQFYARLVKKVVGVAQSVAEKTPAAPEFAWQLDTTRSGVLMVEEPPFGLPDGEQMRWTAAARQALAAGRTKAGPDQEMLNALLKAKFKNPMLGIYAGHLLAMDENPRLDLLHEVAENLMQLIGEHPDVTALLIPLKDTRAKDLQYSEPPMLRSSWSMIVDASTPEKDLRPARSYASRIGGSLWGTGAWLAWRMPAEAESVLASPKALLSLYAQALTGKLTPAIQSVISSGDWRSKLTPVELLLARYLDLVSAQFRMARKYTAEDDQRSSFSAFYSVIRPFFDSDIIKGTKQALTPSYITRMTGLPYSTIVDAASTLATKLKDTKGLRS